MNCLQWYLGEVRIRWSHFGRWSQRFDCNTASLHQDEVVVYVSLFVARWLAAIGAFRFSLLFRLLDSKVLIDQLLCCVIVGIQVSGISIPLSTSIWGTGDSKSTCKPKIWKRYVDDSFTVSDRDHVNGFLQHLNSQQPTIRFTMEIEKDNTIPFLDTTVTWDSDGLLNSTVHCLRLAHSAPRIRR